MHVIRSIVDQHLEEAAFLWLLRNSAINSPHYALTHLTKLDGQIDAHLDGLRIADESGWQSCHQSLSTGEAGESFTSAVLAFESGQVVRIQAILETLDAFPAASQGIVSALGWLSFEQAEPNIRLLLSSEITAWRRIGLAAAAIHRHDPSTHLVEALSDDDLLLCARACKAVGELGRVELTPQLQPHLTTQAEKSRFYAAWSLALLTGEAQAIEVLRTVAASTSHYREKALQMALRRMSLAEGHHWCKVLSQQSETIRLAIIGAGIMGDPVVVPWLLEQMRVPALARVAGEALTMITDVDIAGADLEGEWPEGFEAGPTEDPEDENVEMDQDENLPWPNPDLVANWWSRNRTRFQTGARYLLGETIDIAWLQEVLRRGYQRQRVAAALELSIRQPGTPLFETRAPGFRQRQQLGI